MINAAFQGGRNHIQALAPHPAVVTIVNRARHAPPRLLWVLSTNVNLYRQTRVEVWIALWRDLDMLMSRERVAREGGVQLEEASLDAVESR